MPCRSSLNRPYPHKVFHTSCACATFLLDMERNCTYQPVDNMYADQPPCMTESRDLPVRRTCCPRCLCAPSHAGSATCRMSWPAGSMYHHPQQYMCRSRSSGQQTRPHARSPQDSGGSRMNLSECSTHRQPFVSNPRRNRECVGHHA